MKARLFTFQYVNSAETEVLEKSKNFWAIMKLIIPQNILQIFLKQFLSKWQHC